MTPNSGATTRTVQPTPQFGMPKGDTVEPASTEVPMSAEVRAEMERRFLDLLSKLNDADIGYASLSEPERRRIGSAFLKEEALNPDWFNAPDIDPPAEVEPQTQTAAQLSPEAQIIAGMERLTDERCYQMVAAMTEYAKKLHEYGEAHPDRVREAVQSDFELAA